MTVTASETRVSYNGNGVTTAFDFPYTFFQNADLIVYLVEIADNDNYEIQVLDTDYTVTGAGGANGGQVTMAVAPPNTHKVVIVNDPAIIQDKDYVNADDFPAESHEEALDRLTKIAQRTRDILERCLRISDVSDDDPPDVSEVLEACADAVASAAAAATSETNAAASETAAAASETAAATSATAAAGSATSAASSATTATTKAGEAATSATNAANSASAAATSETNAATSETNAAASETAAAASAAAAATSETNAATSETNAAASAAAAASSAASLVNVMTLVGNWDASGGSFPSTANRKAGWVYVVTVAGTVDGVAFGVDDKLVALVDDASTSTYSGNWFKVEGGTITSSQISAALGFTPAREFTADNGASLASDIVRNNIPAGQVQLTYVSSTQIKLERCGGKWLWINGKNESVPSSGPTASNTGLTAGTLYYVYAYMNSGTMTLELSTTVPVADSTYGVMVKTGDGTRTLVGAVYTDAGTPGTFLNDITHAWVRSWYHPQDYSLFANGSVSISSALSEYTGLTLYALMWNGESIHQQFSTYAYLSSGASAVLSSRAYAGGTGVGATLLASATASVFGTAAGAYPTTKTGTAGLATYNYFRVGLGTDAGTAAFNAAISAQLRGKTQTS